MSASKAETYCSACHWQYCRHFKTIWGMECPNPEGLYEPGIGLFSERVPIHGLPGANEAVEATDAEEEPFDFHRAWRAQMIGMVCIIILAVLIAVLGGVYIGHFMWV